MTNDRHQPEQVIFAVYGVNADDISHVWDMEESEQAKGFDHEAHELATMVMETLQSSRFDWTDDITGVAMGAQKE